MATKVNKQSSLIPQLNKEHTFQSFIEGSNNQFAKNAAQAVAENAGSQSFNPLIIYGGTGLGKTHLIHAIGNKVLENKSNQNKQIKILTLSTISNKFLRIASFSYVLIDQITH